MKKINAIIVDDERLARNALKNKLEHFKQINIVGEANSVNSAVKLIKEKKPDLLFLDIQLYNETGFDILNKLNFTGKVIFVTAYDEYAIRAFEINAVDYLLKPISVERLDNAISRIYLNDPQIDNDFIYNYDDRILVTQTTGMRFIKINSIKYISSSGDYSEIHTAKKSYLMSKSMGEWEKRLPENNFFRIHRSYIVNIEFVERTEKWVNYSSLVYLKDLKEPLKISRNYLKKFKERFM